MMTIGNAEVERDSTVWLFDGNIVLLAQGNVAFRVHKGVLALHSEFFGGMFEQPPHVTCKPEDEPEEEIDGCPIVPVDDSAYDILQLLLVMYGKNRLKTPEETTFTIVAALIRVGDKYGVHDIVNECSRQLCPMVPTILKDYEKASEHRYAIKFAPHNAPEALHVFRLLDLDHDGPHIITFMLFLCAQLDEQELRNGTAREDGTLEKLSDCDLERILTLKGELQQRGEYALDGVFYFDEPGSDCQCLDGDSNMGCDEGYGRFTSSIPISVQDAYRRGDLFGRGIVDRMYDLEISHLVCRRCYMSKVVQQVQLRNETWEALPVLAGTITGTARHDGGASA